MSWASFSHYHCLTWHFALPQASSSRASWSQASEPVSRNKHVSLLHCFLGDSVAVMDSVQHTTSLGAGKIFSSTHPGQLEDSLKNTRSFKFTSTLQGIQPLASCCDHFMSNALVISSCPPLQTEVRFENVILSLSTLKFPGGWRVYLSADRAACHVWGPEA